MSAKPAEAAKPADAAKKDGAAEAAPAAGGGGIKAWLPLILCVVLMPALAYATTMFLVVPKLQQAVANGSHGTDGESGDAAHGTEDSGGKEHGGKEAGKDAAAPDAHGGKGSAKGSGKAKTSVPVEKILVNLAGSMGTRYLLTRFSLVSEKSDFKDLVEKNLDQLKDLAMGIMGAKSITDLEKPGSKNLIRAEIISAYNSVLGTGTVQELYFTEFTIQ